MKDIFGIENFNIIQDSENYYFFRALNMADNKDLEENIITDENGKIKKIRTDRERYKEKLSPKYNKNSSISLEQIYDHIKMHYRKDTNCISLSSNANVSISYGRGYYKDRYIIVKIPKKEFGEKTINAGQYMLKKIQQKIDEYMSTLDDKIEITKLFSQIDNAKTSKELNKTIEEKYTSKELLNPNKAKLRKKIIYRAPTARISSYGVLSDEQSLEKNKIMAKLTVLERKVGMEPIIPLTAKNNLLIQTVGSAFSSLEVIHYGDIQKENIIDIPKEIVDIFAILQQVDGQKEIVADLKKEVIKAINDGRKIKIPEESKYGSIEDISINKMYKLTQGKVEYGKANSIAKNMYYLAKGQSRAKEFVKVLEQIVDHNPKYNEIIQYISENGLEVEPEIITRRSGKGIKLSESVNLDIEDEEIVDKIKELSQQEQIEILEKNGLSDSVIATILDKS